MIKVEFNTGKLSDLSVNETRKVDHVWVLVSSLKDSNTKILRIPELLSGTGEAGANTIFEFLIMEMWFSSYWHALRYSFLKYR